MKGCAVCGQTLMNSVSEILNPILAAKVTIAVFKAKAKAKAKKKREQC